MTASERLTKDHDFNFPMIPLPASTRIEALLAPYHEISGDSYVTIEHPGIIKNLERGVLTLGGDKAISNVRSYLSR